MCNQQAVIAAKHLLYLLFIYFQGGDNEVHRLCVLVKNLADLILQCTTGLHFGLVVLLLSTVFVSFVLLLVECFKYGALLI